jgi:hypothetical protein
MDEDVRAKLEAKMLKPTGETPGTDRARTAAEATPFKVQARAMGLKPGYNLDKIWELIEQVEGPDYR